MSTTAELRPGHPVERALTGLDELLDEVAGVPLWSLSAEEVERLTLDSYATLARLQGLVVRLVGEADSRDVAGSVGATSTTSWLLGAARLRPGQAKATVDTARAIRQRLTATGEALDSGAVSAEHAAVVARAVADLPGDVAPDVPEQAEQVLLEEARQCDPLALTRLGRRILEVVDPDGVDERLGKALEREEARAERTQHLRLTPDGRGGCWLRGRLGIEDTAALRAVLEPLAAPRQTADDGPDLRPYDRRMADALGEACRRLLDCDELPADGAQATQVVVTIPWDVLLRGLGTANLLPDGDPLSPATARRLACGATIMPAVLGTMGEVLDLGRRTRLFSGALRRALDLRDAGCAFPGCSRPSRWCDGHHIVGWWAGGETSLSNGVLLCGWHHRLIHRDEWVVRMASDGMPEFLPPVWIDPQRRPRRNARMSRRRC